MFGAFFLLAYYGETRPTVASAVRWYRFNNHGRAAFLTSAEVLNMIVLGAVGSLLFILGIAFDPKSGQRVWRRHR